MKLLTMLKNIKAVKIDVAILGFIIGVIATILAGVVISVWLHSFVKRTQSEIHSIAQARFVRDALREQDTLILNRESCVPSTADDSDKRDKIAWWVRCSASVVGSEEQILILYAIDAQGSIIYKDSGAQNEN